MPKSIRPKTVGLLINSEKKLITLDFGGDIMQVMTRLESVWDILISLRRVGDHSEFGVVMKKDDVILALTIEVDGLYIKAVTKIEEANLTSKRFTQSFVLTEEETRYRDLGKNVVMNQGKIRNLFTYLNTQWNKETTFDSEQMKLLFFLTAEACRFRTTRFGVKQALVNVESPVVSWINHAEILHHWSAVQAALALPENRVIEIEKLEEYARGAGEANLKVRGNLMRLGYMTGY